MIEIDRRYSPCGCGHYFEEHEQEQLKISYNGKEESGLAGGKCKECSGTRRCSFFVRGTSEEHRFWYTSDVHAVIELDWNVST